MIDLAWLCAFAIRCVYWLVLLACNFLGYSTLWAHREIKQRGQRLDSRYCAVPAHVAIVNNGTTMNKEMLVSLLEVALVENIRRLTIYDPSHDYAQLAQEIKGFCRTRHIRIVMGCATNFDNISTDRLCVQLLSANSGRPVLVEACRELSSSNSPVTASAVNGLLATKYSLLEPDLLIQVGSIPSLSGYPPWCLRVTEFVPVRSLPCSRFAFDECLDAYGKRDIRLGK